MGILQQTPEEYYDQNVFGQYQFVSLSDIINQFLIVYVGEEKIISKTNRTDVAFHAQRALAELTFDTLKSIKSEEILLPPSLNMLLPQDYVNYTKISSIDNSGIKHRLYPTLNNTSNPRAYYQDSNGEHKINPIATLTENSNIIVLDSDYSGLLVHGMQVQGLNIPNASYIHNITTTAGITSITLENKNGTVDKNATATTNQQIKITRFNFLGPGRRIAYQSLVETTATAITNTSTNPTVVNVASVDGIEVGMFINHPAFVNNNDIQGGRAAITVIGVGTSTIELSHPVHANHSVAVDDVIGFVTNNNDSKTLDNYKSNKPSENRQHDYDYDDHIFEANVGRRYGLEPSHAQDNGSFYIDELRGIINFSSNLSGSIIVLDYISDSLGKDSEMQVHKFAEEAMYKSIMHAILSTKSNTPEYVIRRYQKEKFAAIRQAKLRLSNLKLEELTQILRGKSKQIKH
tara:strand:+ start:957 stop:2339 length:1383 start_codon:yes stop_codon:yes gene_type:complete